MVDWWVEPHPKIGFVLLVVGMVLLTMMAAFYPQPPGQELEA